MILKFLLGFFLFSIAAGAAMLLCDFVHWHAMERRRRHRRGRCEDLHAKVDAQLREDLQHGRELPHEH